jgi:hypothetical protein
MIENRNAGVERPKSECLDLSHTKRAYPDFTHTFIDTYITYARDSVHGSSERRQNQREKKVHITDSFFKAQF